MIFDVSQHFSHRVVIDVSREDKQFFFAFAVFGSDEFHSALSLFCSAGLSRLSRPALTFRTAAVWGRVEREGKPSATAGYRSKKLPGPYDFIDVLTSRLAPLGCIQINRNNDDLGCVVTRFPLLV